MAINKIVKNSLGADAIDATKIADNAISEEHLDVTSITGQTELATTAADDDLLLIYDTSTGGLKKIQKSNIATTLAYSHDTATGDGSTAGFTINSGRGVNDMLVFVNGVLMTPTTDYTISSTTLTFGTAPASGVAIIIRELP